MTTHTPQHQPAVTRRTLLTAVSAFSVLSLAQWPGMARADGLSLDDFMALSKDKVGRGDLDKDIGKRMLDAFMRIGKQDDLSAMSGGAGNADLANSVVAAWYTGVSPDPDDLAVLTYTDALMWDAMDYTKPMAICGGETGYWSKPPAG